MIDVNELRRGTTFTHEDNLLRVLDYDHRKMGRGKATIRVKVLNIRTESTYELTFNSGVRVDDIRLNKATYEYLYDDGQFFVFMDVETFDQKQVPYAIFGDEKGYLKNNQTLELLDYEGEVLDYKFPSSIDMEVIDAEAAVAGDTATGATKLVTLETGLQVRTPLFIEVGNTIKINTASGEYITRA